MFDAHPPFQIDGNFGGATGIAEMLLQIATPDEIDLLPALPKPGRPERSRPARRGGFEFDLAWKDGTLTRATVRSRVGGPCHLRYRGKEITLPTEKGQQYSLDANLKS